MGSNETLNGQSSNRKMVQNVLTSTHILKDMALWDLQQAINKTGGVPVFLPLWKVVHLYVGQSSEV